MIHSQPTIQLSGTVERVTFHSIESGYCVLRVKVRAFRELVTVVGYASSVKPGEDIESYGEWVQTKEYGRQFKAKSIRMVPPSSIEGIEKYLGSGLIKGIGPHFAKKLVKAFGVDVFDVIENRPDCLRSVEGIGPKRIEKVIAAWKDQRIIRGIMVFLQSHGVSTSKAVRIFKTYGQEAIEKVKADPYQLARDIYGIGFKSADLIAEKLGISKNSLLRARAGLSYVLMQKVQDGHCAFPEADLLTESVRLLEIDLSILKEALFLELNEKRLIREEIDQVPCIFPISLFRSEEEIARLIKILQQGLPPWGELDVRNLIAKVEKQTKLELAPLQKEAVCLALSSKMTLITGGPGTGKSTLTRVILACLEARNLRMALCSPTGRAAKRLSECTGMEAKTIHRTLGFDPKKGGFLHKQENPLPIDLLLIDEASMVDVSLAHALLKAVPPHAAVIIVGDMDQLPSVGPGQFLADLIHSNKIPTVKLTEIFRQAAQSRIIRVAHAINKSIFPKLDHEPGSDFFYIPSDDPDQTVNKIVEIVKNRIPAKFGYDPIQDIQVLCPLQRGILGARNLNEALQKSLNPTPVQSVERFGYRFCTGDKVMVLQNDYDKEVFNGDIGYIQEVHSEDQECVIRFEGKDILFDFGELDILQPAYTITIHKSQGSEYPVVIIPIATQHYMMLRKNLIYTAVTRGKKLVILIGQKKALAIALNTKDSGKRYTRLEKRLHQWISQ